MAGAAITISLQQLRGLFNITPAHFTQHTDVVSVMRSVFGNTDEVIADSHKQIPLG